MKKTIAIATLLFAYLSASAQEGPVNPFQDRALLHEIITTASILPTFVLIAGFILLLTKTILEHRLKSKMIDRSVSETLAEQLLKPTRKTNRYAAIKWFTFFAGLGVGLLIVGFAQPFGIHSLAIISISMAASFLGYYYFVKRAEQ